MHKNKNAPVCKDRFQRKLGPKAKNTATGKLIIDPRGSKSPEFRTHYK